MHLLCAGISHQRGALFFFCTHTAKSYTSKAQTASILHFHTILHTKVRFLIISLRKNPVLLLFSFSDSCIFCHMFATVAFEL